MNSALRNIIRNPTPVELELVARYASLSRDPARERLFDVFARTGLPNRRMEGWRWSDFKLGVKGLEGDIQAADPLAPESTAGLVFGPDGLGVNLLPAGARLLQRQDVQAVGGAEEIPMGALAASLAGGDGIPSTVYLEISGSSPVGLHIVFRGAARVHAARIVVLIRSGARLEVTESHLGGCGLSASLLEYTLEAGAQLNRTVFQNAGSGSAQVITACIDQEAGAETEQTVLALGAGACRIETRLVHRGVGSRCVLNAAYLAAAGRHVDLTSHVRHGAQACVTRQLTRGAVMEGGRGVFQGKFHVPRHAGQQTDASMQHNALLLSEGAEVFAKPELEILADDVQCAHGNTCGDLDDQQIFYMRQRGIPLHQARALLISAFLVEALSPAGDLAARLQGEIEAGLKE